jgi:thioredoxin reductase (NADPH)
MAHSTASAETTSLHRKVIIIGAGPAGYTAGIYTSRALLSPLILTGFSKGGQLSTTTDVENFPGFPEGIMGPELMEAMEKQAERFGATIKFEMVDKVDFSKRPFTLKTSDAEYTCDTVIIATGASPKYIGIPNEQELIGYGVSTCATCDGAFFRGKVVSIVGGGDSACEEALFLTRFASKVYLIHRRDELRASMIMQDRVKQNGKIEILWNKQVKEIFGSKEEGVTALTLVDTTTQELSKVEASALFVAIGHTPNSELFKGMLEMDENGYLITAPHSSKTNIEGVFACGDVQDHTFRQAITAAGSGCMAAIEVERFLAS